MTDMAVELESELIALTRRCADRYQTVRVLGRGSMGIVYLCRDLVLHRLVAIKVLREEHRTSPLHRELFLREARFAAEFGEDGFVPVLDIIDDGSVTAFIMPNAGISLTEHVARHGPLPPADVRGLLTTLAGALAPLHRRAMVHRDVKPDNVLLSQHNGRLRVQLTDFGIAAALLADRDVTRGALVAGSPGFMPPEQVLDPRSADARSDLYALGALAYFALTGEAPFPVGPLSEVLKLQRLGRYRPLRSLRRDIPRGLARAVTRCLRPRPADRWARASDLIAAIAEQGARSWSWTPWVSRRAGVQPA